MSTATEPRDYLGHPCQLSALHAYCEWQMDRYRKEYGDHADPRALVRQIGNTLNELAGRMTDATHALEAIHGEAENPRRTLALLAMGIEHSAKSEDLLMDLATLVMVALERGEGYPDHLKPKSVEIA